MSPRMNRDEVFERKLEQRIMERLDERLVRYVDRINEHMEELLNGKRDDVQSHENEESSGENLLDDDDSYSKISSEEETMYDGPPVYDTEIPSEEALYDGPPVYDEELPPEEVVFDEYPVDDEEISPDEEFEIGDTDVNLMVRRSFYAQKKKKVPLTFDSEQHYVGLFVYVFLEEKDIISSRLFGPVSLSNIIGRVWYLPVMEMKLEVDSLGRDFGKTHVKQSSGEPPTPISSPHSLHFYSLPDFSLYTLLKCRMTNDFFTTKSVYVLQITVPFAAVLNETVLGTFKRLVLLMVLDFSRNDANKAAPISTRSPQIFELYGDKYLVLVHGNLVIRHGDKDGDIGDIAQTETCQWLIAGSKSGECNTASIPEHAGEWVLQFAAVVKNILFNDESFAHQHFMGYSDAFAPNQQFSSQSPSSFVPKMIRSLDEFSLLMTTIDSVNWAHHRQLPRIPVTNSGSFWSAKTKNVFGYWYRWWVDYKLLLGQFGWIYIMLLSRWFMFVVEESISSNVVTMRCESRWILKWWCWKSRYAFSVAGLGQTTSIVLLLVIEEHEVVNGSVIGVGTIVGITFGYAILIIIVIRLVLYAICQQARAAKVLGLNINNFHVSDYLRFGGYGRVDKEIVPGVQVADINRVQQTSVQGELELKTEIELLSQVLIPIGFVTEETETVIRLNVLRHVGA